MKDSLRTIIFAAVLGIVCSLLLVGTSTITVPRRRANEQAEEVRNYLAVLGVPLPEKASAAEMLKVFQEQVKTRELGDLTLYEYIPAGSTEVQTVAVPIAGPGLWGPIQGVIALEPDLATIRGISFYKQEETPGLGGEIASDAFRSRFQGKRLVSAAGSPGFRITKPGTPKAIDAVDGITGATMTSDFVGAILNDLAHKLRSN